VIGWIRRRRQAREAAAERAAAALRGDPEPEPEPAWVPTNVPVCRTCGSANVTARTVAGFTEYFCAQCLAPGKDEPLPDFNDPHWYGNKQ